VRSNKNQRLNMVLPAQTFSRLEKLREETEATSYVEVVKNALRLYEAFIEDTVSGKEILARDPGGELTTYKLFA
jgi:hypothetical protein